MVCGACLRELRSTGPNSWEPCTQHPAVPPIQKKPAVRVTLTLTVDDWENLPLALGYATAAIAAEEIVLERMRGRPTSDDRELARRVVKRLIALHDACTLAHVQR